MYAYMIACGRKEAESIWGSPALLEAWMRFLALLLSVVAVLGMSKKRKQSDVRTITRTELRQMTLVRKMSL